MQTVDANQSRWALFTLSFHKINGDKINKQRSINERENELLEQLIPRMRDEFLQRKHMYSQLSTNLEVLTKYMKDYLDRKVY